MKLRVTKFRMLALMLAFSGTQDAMAESKGGADKEWTRSGFGSSPNYKCRQPSCGGAKSRFFSQRFGGIGAVPELGVPSGSNLEAEIRRRPEVRRILAAMLQQVVKESGNKGSGISTTYFANAGHVGFNFTAFDARGKMHMAMQLRINDDKALMIGSMAETLPLARRNFKLLVPNVKGN